MSRASKLPKAIATESRGVRSLHLDTPWVQGSMRVSQPLKLELEYVRRMMAWALFWPTSAFSVSALAQRRALHLGLGAASLTKFTHQVLGMQTRAIELNPGVIELCRSVFGLSQNDDRLTVEQADAGAWVRQGGLSLPGSQHLVFADLYDREAAAPVFDSPEFYADCRALLADEGLLCINLFGRRAVFARSVAAVAEAFGKSQVFALAPTREGNRVVIASKTLKLPDHRVRGARARALEARWKPLGMEAAKWAGLIRPAF